MSMCHPGYGDFLRRKFPAPMPTGRDPGPVNLPGLFDYQRAIVRWAVGQGRAAIFAGTGLGKTAMQLAWADLVRRDRLRPVLILTPLAVAPQTVREGEKFGIKVKHAREHKDVLGSGIYVTNYEALHKFKPEMFAGVVLDECFARGTPIDMADGRRRSIERIRVGDRIVNASGIDTVSDVHRREVQYAVRLRISGRLVISSPNHPYFTRRGWVAAQDLVPGDEVVATSEAMRMVREGVRSALCPGREEAVLRAILLSEMADETGRGLGQGACPGSGRQKGAEEVGVAPIRAPKGGGGEGPDWSPESGDQAGSPGEDLPPIEVHEPQTFRAWGQWIGGDGPATDPDGCTWSGVGGGVCLVTGPANSGLSHALQDRLGESRAANRHRGGWSLAPDAGVAREGCEEGGEARFARVEGLEVLERGHPDLESFRDADGRIYFYDLGGTRHPSFSVLGALVHNSSILKAFTGSTKRKLCDAFADTEVTPCKLACTATPSPNDFMEIGNHAEFLGVMPSSEMLMRYFIADSMNAGKYRIKRHAERDFWRWLASWSVAFSRPSDLGFEDQPGHVLPELRQHIHEAEVKGFPEAGDPPTLFKTECVGALSIHRERRLTIEDRARITAEIVAAEDSPCVIWVDTNYEADAIRALLPDAIEVRGADPAERKEQNLHGFSLGQIKALITKPSIAGYGLNWQVCHRMVFAGLSFSFEDMHQAIARCWRFGQTHPVDVHVIATETESQVLRTIRRKAEQHGLMVREIAAVCRENGLGAFNPSPRLRDVEPIPALLPIPGWLKTEEIAS